MRQLLQLLVAMLVAAGCVAAAGTAGAAGGRKGGRSKTAAAGVFSKLMGGAGGGGSSAAAAATPDGAAAVEPASGPELAALVAAGAASVCLAHGGERFCGQFSPAGIPAAAGGAAGGLRKAVALRKATAKLRRRLSRKLLGLKPADGEARRHRLPSPTTPLCPLSESHSRPCCPVGHRRPSCCGRGTVRCTRSSSSPRRRHSSAASEAAAHTAIRHAFLPCCLVRCYRIVPSAHIGRNAMNVVRLGRQATARAARRSKSSAGRPLPSGTAPPWPVR